MIEDDPQIAELDCNPAKVMPRGGGYWVVDARIMVKQRPETRVNMVLFSANND